MKIKLLYDKLYTLKNQLKEVAMLKNFFVVWSMFLFTSVFAADNNSSIMLPITAGTHTFTSSAFNSNGVATFAIPNFSCSAPYLYPWVTVYPIEIVAGDDWWQVHTGKTGDMNLIKNIIITPKYSPAGCDVTVAFNSEYSSCSGDPIVCVRHLVSAAKATSTLFGGEDGHVTVTYVAYCNTQPIQSDTDKREPEQTK